MREVKGANDYVCDKLARWFEGHGVEARVIGDVVRFPAHPGLWANGTLFVYSRTIVQLDVRLGSFDGKRTLVESIAGFGDDLDAQARSAFDLLANGSLHVLLAAFFGREPCHGTQREVWSQRIAYTGLITTVHGFPPPGASGQPDLGFYPVFKRHIERQPVPPGTHWIRLYQMQRAGESLCNEVLLDNEPWDTLATLMAAYAWPVSPTPYDLRTFLVLKDR